MVCAFRRQAATLTAARTTPVDNESPQERRQRLAQQLFGLRPPDALASLTRSSTGSASEAQLGMAKHIATTILADLVQQCQKAWRHMGPGILVVRRLQDDAIWSDLEDINANRKIAENEGDAGMAAVFHSILDQLDGLDIEQEVLVAFTDATSIRVLPIPATNPARGVAKLLDAWNG